MPYQITLTDTQAIELEAELQRIENVARGAIESINRKRSWTPAERAMACVPYQRRLQIIRDFRAAPMTRILGD